VNYDIVVIAGTSESRKVIEDSLEKGCRILASVATDLGKEMLDEYPIDVHVGRLDLEGFLTFFKENPVKKVIDASHPFARIVTETVKEACAISCIPYERYEREKSDYDYDRICQVENVDQAVALLNESAGNILLTTGVNTAGEYFRKVKDAPARLFIRVLDNEASYERCRKAGYSDDHVFGEMPPFSLKDNLRLIRKVQAAVLVSKDSGKRGGVDIKVRACREAGIPMILIKRP